MGLKTKNTVEFRLSVGRAAVKLIESLTEAPAPKKKWTDDPDESDYSYAVQDLVESLKQVEEYFGTLEGLEPANHDDAFPVLMKEIRFGLSSAIKAALKLPKV